MINRFSGEHAFMSNFFPSEVVLDGEIYPTVEHAYQAAKTTLKEEREIVRKAPSAGTAKRLGQKVTLRPDWEFVKIWIMTHLLDQKFSNPDLRERLRKTGKDMLIEGNDWNGLFWGVDSTTNTGNNVLGLILMAIRSRI